MDYSSSQKIRNDLHALWSIGLPVVYTQTSSIDEEGSHQELFTLSTDKLRAAEFSSHDQDEVNRHLSNLLGNKLAVVKLLGKDIVISPDAAQGLKDSLKEQLGLELDVGNTYLIEIGTYQSKGHVSCNTPGNIRLQALGIKGLVELFDVLKPVKGAYPSISFTNVDPDELKACLDDY